MGKKWDYDVPSKEIWEECLRVLKPGGHLLSFAGSRTYHRMAVRIEDAGFEIRDQIMWIYGSGFPKSHNIGKAVDKIEGNERKVVGYVPQFPDGTRGATYRGQAKNSNNVNFFVSKDTSTNGLKPVYAKNNDWEGWGTALKPAHEPIVMARKPFKGNVAQNVLEWGTGAINIDESRIPMSSMDYKIIDAKSSKNPTSNYKESATKKYGDYQKDMAMPPNDLGRFPANVIFDEQAGKILDKQSGVSKSSGGRSENKDGIGQNGIFGQFKGEVRDENPGLGDIGGASRFFYCPKASKKDRNEGLDSFLDQERINYGGFHSDKGLIQNNRNPENRKPNKNNHPTIKPTDLMLYLIRLVTPKEGTTLDPFMGSGSTGKAAIRGGFKFFGIERESEYFDIAQARLDYEVEKLKSAQTKLDI